MSEVCISRRGLFMGAAALGLVGCGKPQLKHYGTHESFDSFDPARPHLILFSSANLVSFCADSVDVFVKSVGRLPVTQSVYVVMPDPERTKDHTTLNKFLPYLGRRNFSLLIGGNDDAHDLALKHNEGYLFNRDGEVLMHPVNIYLLHSGRDRAKNIGTYATPEKLIESLKQEIRVSGDLRYADVGMS